jgi:hypothetical protein
MLGVSVWKNELLRARQKACGMVHSVQPRIQPLKRGWPRSDPIRLEIMHQYTIDMIL